MQKNLYVKILLLLIPAFLFWSCNNYIEEQGYENAGSLNLSLVHENGIESKADGLDTDNYEIIIYKDGVQYARFLRFADMPQPTKLQVGSYTVKALRGMNKNIAFDEPFYMGTANFTITADQTSTASITCYLSNTKLTIDADEVFKNTFSEYYAVITTSYHTDEDPLFVVSQSEIGNPSKAVFVKSDGDIKITMHLKKGGQNYVYGLPLIAGIKPREHYKVTLKGSTTQIPFSISINEELNGVDETHVISEDWLIKDAPSVTAAFDNTLPLTVYSGWMRHNSISALIKAPAGIENLKLYVNSPELNADGIPAVVDFSEMTDELKEKLNGWGIAWNGEMTGSTANVIRFTGLQEKLTENGGEFSENIFGIEVYDKYDQSDALQNITLKVYPIKFTLPEVPAGDVWARFAYMRKADVQSGPADEMDFIYEIKKESANAWTRIDINNDRELINNLSPNTAYNARARFMKYSSETVDFTTEKDSQIPNAGFEDWQRTWVYKGGSTLWVTSADIYEDKVYADGQTQYWFTRNPLTTSQKTEQSMSYTAYSGVVPVSGASGRAAEISTVGWSRMNTYTGAGMTAAIIKNKTAGLLFLGEGAAYTFAIKDDGIYNVLDWENYYPGMGFGSRPTQISFKYKFKNLNGEAFRASAKVENRDSGVVELASTQMESNTDASGFTTVTLNFEYDSALLNMKATHISITFISSTADSPSVTGITGSVGAFNVYRDSRYQGNVLTIDDIELGYTAAPTLK